MAIPLDGPTEGAPERAGRARAGSRAARIFVLLAAVGLSGVYTIVLCDIVYACGCKSWWAGAAAACNIHAASPPHCPWCEVGWWGLFGPLAAVAGVQAAVLLWPGRASLLARTLLAAAAFPAIGTMVAVVWGMITGYWR